MYSNHLNIGLIWYSNGRFVPGLQIVWYSNGGLKTGPKMSALWSKMSCFQIVCLVTWQIPSENWTFKSPVFRWIWYSGVQYSDGYCTVLVHSRCWCGGRSPNAIAAALHLQLTQHAHALQLREQGGEHHLPQQEQVHQDQHRKTFSQNGRQTPV